MPNIIWAPQPKQQVFMSRPEYEALYGGAAGGGKSDALLIEALRQVHIPHYRAILLRKTYPQLSDLIDRSMELYTPAFPRARYNDSKHFWRFPSGAKIIFGSMHHAQDRIQYQGKHFDFVGFDELTHFTWEEYSYLFSRNRPNGPGTRVYLRATANPGGVGHGWVKDRFITAATPMTPITGTYDVIIPDGKRETRTRTRIFVPATVFDNPALLNNNPDYISSLAMMSEAEKRALLYGDWNSFDGQVFREWRNDPTHYDDQRWTHVIRPFKIPGHWRVVRGFDFGYARPFSVGWYAADEEGRMYRIKELYGCDNPANAPNTGVRMEPTAIAAEIRRIETDDPMLKGRNIEGIADPSIFDESRGESIASMMAKSPNFIYWRKGDNTRIPGKMQYHYRLAIDADGRPMFQVFDNCKQFIRTLPSLVYDNKHVEDIDTAQEDHIYDECRYVFMDSPISPKAFKPPDVPEYDPLEIKAQTKDVYKFYRI